MPKKETAMTAKKPKTPGQLRKEKNLMPNIAKEAMENLPAGTNTAYITFLAEVQAIGIGSNRKDPKDLRERFMRYIALCAERDMRIGNIAAYSAMGLVHRDVQDLEKSANPELRQLMGQVKAFCSCYREMLANNNDVNVAWSIFSAKNYDGMSDAPQTVVVTKDPLGDTQDKESIAAKYEDLPD